MKKKTFNLGETSYIGDGERFCFRLPKFVLDLLDEASSGRTSPSQNELLRRLFWMAKWVLENKEEDVFEKLEVDHSDQVLNGTLEGKLSDVEREDFSLDSSVFEDIPFGEGDMLLMVTDAPWIDFEDLPERRLRERFPFTATHVRIVSLIMDIWREDYSSTPKRLRRAMSLFVKRDSLRWVPRALKRL